MIYKYPTYAVSVPQIKKILGMKSNPYTFTSEDDWDISYPFTVELKGKNGGVIVTLNDPKSRGEDDISYGLAYVNSRIYKYLSRPVDEVLKGRIEALLAKNRTNKFLNSVLEQVNEGYELSLAQLEVITKIEQNMSPNNPMVARIQSALKVNPSSSFLRSLLSQAQSGFTLSPKQLSILDGFPTEEMDPAEVILKELLKNAILSREDRVMIENILSHGMGVASEDGLKRIRHILYSQGRRLSGIPDKDTIRKLFGK